MCRKIEDLILIVLGIMLVGFACGTRQQPPSSVQQEPSTKIDMPPVVEITLDPASRIDRPLVIHWKIINNGPGAIYIYSTPIERPFSANLFIDPPRQIIEVRWLQLQPIPVGINDFPEAKFLEIGPRASRGGVFKSYVAVKNLVTYKSADSTIREERVAPGSWKIQLLVAYGNEIDSVKKDLAESLRRGTEHPINPIVRWQKVAYSEPVSVTFQK